MARGHPLNIIRTDLIDAINETGGNIRQTSKLLGISYMSVYNLMEDDEELKDILDKARKRCVENLMDMAINTFESTMDDLENNPKLAADISKFLVEKRGHTRYLGKGKDGEEENERAIDQYTGLMTQLTLMQKRAKHDSSSSTGSVQPETT